MCPRSPRLTSLHDLTNASVAESHSHAPRSSGKPAQKSERYYNRKGRLNLERDVQDAHVGVMVRCPKTFSAISTQNVIINVYKMISKKNNNVTDKNTL